MNETPVKQPDGRSQTSPVDQQPAPVPPDTAPGQRSVLLAGVWLMVAVGALALVGWTSGIAWLRGGIAGQPIHANGAAAMVLLAVAALCTLREGRLVRSVGVASSAAAATLAVAAFSANRGGPGAALDALLVPAVPVPVEFARIGTVGSFAVVGLTVALALRLLRPSSFRTFLVLLLVPTFGAVTILLGWGFGASAMLQAGGGRPSGPLGAVPLILLAAGLAIDALPAGWWSRLTARTPGMRLIRRLVPLSVVWLLVDGLLLNMRLHRLGTGHEADVAAAIVVSAVVVSWLLVTTGVRLDRQLAVAAEARSALAVVRDRTRRAALAFNDEVVQLLATAWLADELGHPRAARGTALQALQRAQAIASMLLRATGGGGAVLPGALVRSADGGPTADPHLAATAGSAAAGAKNGLLRISVGLGTAVGSIWLLGWVTGAAWITRGALFGPVSVTAGLAALMFAVAVWASTRSGRLARIVALTAAAGPALLAAAALSGTLGGTGEAAGALLTPPVPEFAQLSTWASVAFIAFSAALWLRILRPASQRAFVALLAVPLLVAAIGFLGYQLGVAALIHPLGGRPPTPLGLMLIVLFAVGLAVAALPSERWSRIDWGTPGWGLVRRLVPSSIVWLVAVGLLLNTRVAALPGAHAAEIAVAVLAGAVVISALLVDTGVRLDRQLAETERAEAALEAAQAFVQRQALELNDDVVQLLAVAWLAEDLGASDDAREALRRALRSAQASASTLLRGTVGGGPVPPGALVRDATRGPGEPEAVPHGGTAGAGSTIEG